jgi:hypothetical protein
MAVRMRHPESGGEYDAQPSQVPHLQETGWQVIEGQEEQGEVWPAEVQRFEGQPPIRMRHPDLESEITVAESAVPFHRERGWQVIEETEEAAQTAPAGPGDTGGPPGRTRATRGRARVTSEPSEEQTPAAAGQPSEEA